MPFYRLFCKIANLGNIDLKISGSVLDINIDNPVSMPRSCISKIGFSGLWSVIYKPVELSKLFSDFVPPH